MSHETVLLSTQSGPIPNKNRNAIVQLLSNFRKTTSVETISSTSVQMHVRVCCIAQVLQAGVKIVFK